MLEHLISKSILTSNLSIFSKNRKKKKITLEKKKKMQKKIPLFKTSKKIENENLNVMNSKYYNIPQNASRMNAPTKSVKF